jgi:subfamily B ATP-binding cassette protein HlyB/CyaB
MTDTIPNSFQEFLSSINDFEKLPTEAIIDLSQHVQPWRYYIGQKIIGQEKKPDSVIIIYQGKGRLLGYDPRTSIPITLELLEPGAILGEISLLREVACETAIASTEVICLTINATQYLRLFTQYPAFAQTRKHRCHFVEIFDILAAQPQLQVQASANLKQLAQTALPQAKVHYLTPGKTPSQQLDKEYLWFVSGGGTLTDFPFGSRLELSDAKTMLAVSSQNPVRLIGLRSSDLLVPNNSKQIQQPTPHTNRFDLREDLQIPYAPKLEEINRTTTNQTRKSKKYPLISAKGQLKIAIACFQMLCQHLQIPFRPEVIHRVLTDQIKHQGSISLQLCAYLAELIGLKAQLTSIPTVNITRIPTPALISYNQGFAIIYEVGANTVVAGIPERGILHCQKEEFLSQLDVEEGSYPPRIKVLLLSVTNITPKQRFGFQSFLPYLSRYRRVLLEVFVASFFVQLAALANPLVMQLIIDKVIVQNTINTLHILGVLLLVISLFEAVITTLKTYLFVDTTNRIDLGLGAEIIDHLLRLPLCYFESRSVGELSTRINELENIRKFLTGTALTIGLDALFSVIYIIVMLIYSWQLTLVSVGIIPIFIIITLFASPIIRKQLRTQAERNSKTQSYLVEVMTGIQTVKAQNIELRARFCWQELYARYVIASFQTTITSSLANSTSNFLNKLSSLLILWIGAYLVLKGELSLGELIAFRIISSYATSPILRLAQLWQSFQETALSLERLSDIVNTPQEAERDRHNISLPAIEGAIKYENITFRFHPGGPLQLCNVNLDFPAGKFIGIVGQSGAGKSTLMKLLIRLYEPEAGRILIDGYDISKVELYSLRRQIGVVPQDTLLFDGTVQENIALIHPDATTEEIIEAAKIAVAHEFIMKLPHGYNTRVGERGAALSGGQRQRIAIARSVLQKPKLLVLDEATSALDYSTEREVCLNLAKAFQGKTIFLITHRLNTIKNADVIVVMDSGKVIEQGTHEELIALKGHYYYLYQQQEMNF